MAFADDPVVSRVVQLLAEDLGKFTQAEEVDVAVALIAIIAFDQKWYGLTHLCLPLLIEIPALLHEDIAEIKDNDIMQMLVFGHRISDALHLKIHDRALIADILRQVQRPARWRNIPWTDRWVTTDTVRELVADIRDKARTLKPTQGRSWTAARLLKCCATLNARMLDAADMQLARHSMATGLQWHRLAKAPQAESIQIRIHYAASYLSVALRVGIVAKTKRFLLPLWAGQFLADEERLNIDRHFALTFVSTIVFRVLVALRDRADVQTVLPMLQLLYARLFDELFADPAVKAAIATLGEHPTLVVTAYGALVQLPFAALHDGERYLAERFNVVQATPLYRGNFEIGDIDYDAIVGGHALRRRSIRVLAGGKNLHQIKNELDDLTRLAETKNLDLAIGPVDGQRWTDAALRWLLEADGIALLSGHMEASAFDANKAAVVTPDEERLAIGDALEGGVGAELVILAGCHSMGHTDWLAPNENSVVSLLRSAGADAVVSTLWPVEDYASRLYNVALVDGLATGLSRSQAHGMAQRAIMREVATLGQLKAGERLARRNSSISPSVERPDIMESLSHPFYWAGLILTGAWR